MVELFLTYSLFFTRERLKDLDRKAFGWVTSSLLLNMSVFFLWIVWMAHTPKEDLESSLTWKIPTISSLAARSMVAGNSSGHSALHFSALKRRRNIFTPNQRAAILNYYRKPSELSARHQHVCGFIASTWIILCCTSLKSGVCSNATYLWRILMLESDLSFWRRWAENTDEELDRARGSKIPEKIPTFWPMTPFSFNRHHKVAQR